jgi:hypothetical protein
VTITTERTALDGLRSEVLAVLERSAGQWVPVSDLLHQLVPESIAAGRGGPRGPVREASLASAPGGQAIAAVLAGLHRELLAEVTVPLAYRLYDPDEPVGLEEIAARLGVKRVTADTWRTRKKLPAATWPRVGGRPAWRWQVIRDWAIETGRYPGGPNAPRWHGTHGSADEVTASLSELYGRSA